MADSGSVAQGEAAQVVLVLLRYPSSGAGSCPPDQAGAPKRPLYSRLTIGRVEPLGGGATGTPLGQGDLLQETVEPHLALGRSPLCACFLPSRSMLLSLSIKGMGLICSGLQNCEPEQSFP